jgi:SAM-dependent methyltransferase
MSINYDQLAASFDKRYQHLTYPGIQAELRKLIDRPGMDVLEVGCGTGHWLNTLSDLPARYLGVDPSLAMLNKARPQAAGAALVCASAEGLPFSTNSVDLIFCVNAFHHFSDPEKFLKDSASRLRHAGRLAIFGLDPHLPDIKWYVYEHFPGLKEKDLERYIPHEEVARMAARAGFPSVYTKPVERIRQTYLGEQVLGDPFLDRTSTSQFQLISQETYAQGKKNIIDIIENSTGANGPATFVIDLPFLATVACTI